MNILETISQRRSVRSFSSTIMDRREMESVRGILERAASEPGPFGARIRCKLHVDTVGSGEARLGTYGLISGASAFVLPILAPAPGAMEDLGWVVEKAVIDLWAAGWASCWIGGVFSRTKAAGLAGASGEEYVPIVVALGKEAERRSFRDKLIARASRSRQRRALAELCFLPDGSALNGDALASPWNIVLEALRVAPSASNKQPWRLVWDPLALRWMLFLDEDRFYNNSLGNTHLQNIDMGIAMYHFAAAAGCAGLKGSWTPLVEREGFFAEAGGEGVKSMIDMGRKKGWEPIAMWR
ncbi:MAG: nitroreductase family protein [bacterium]